jgi:hypothetical protein
VILIYAAAVIINKGVLFVLFRPIICLGCCYIFLLNFIDIYIWVIVKRGNLLLLVNP